MKIGDTLITTNCPRYAFRVGARAIVTKEPYRDVVDVKWIRDGLDKGQMDGGYGVDLFKIVKTNIWKGKER